jgi:hypothetical protein
LYCHKGIIPTTDKQKRLIVLDDIALQLIQNVVDSQKDLIVIFHQQKPLLTNHAFNRFVGASSFKQYEAEHRSFIENFVPHPSYFNADKISEGESWFDAILKLPEMDRVVSMMPPTYEPHAFSVEISKVGTAFNVVTFKDITQSLIKRIMIENNANIDLSSGAYAKEYFLQIAQSYEDAAHFNEKIIGATRIMISKTDNSSLSSDESSALVSHYKSITRQDDMLIRWDNSSFLLIYLVENEEMAQTVEQKLNSVTQQSSVASLQIVLRSIIQKEDETIKALIRRIV